MNNPTAKRRLPSAALPLLLCFSVVFAQPDDRLDRVVNQYSDATIKLREQIHQYPELGNREFKTAELIANHLRSLGMEVTTNVAHTGVIGLLRGGRPGTVVAVRADMDALPVTEATSYPFKSEVRTTYLGKEVGVMHACGHDVHTGCPDGGRLGPGRVARSDPRHHQVHLSTRRGRPPARRRGWSRADGS